MRDFKFRIWGKDQEIFFSQYEYYLSVDGEVIDFLEHSETRCISEEERGNITIQQYTGCLDKNGKEIYEGDIVNPIHSENSNCVIIFHRYGFYYRFIRNGFSFPLHELCEPEIIGNIFENPDLLMEKQNG